MPSEIDERLCRTSWHESDHPRALPGFRDHLELTPHRGEPVAHVGEAGTGGGGPSIEARTVVADLEAKGAVVGQSDRDQARPCSVLGGILHRLQAAEVDRALHVRRVAPNVTGEQEAG